MTSLIDLPASSFAAVAPRSMTSQKPTTAQRSGFCWMTVAAIERALVASPSPACLATTLISGCWLMTFSAPSIMPLSEPEVPRRPPERD